MCNKPVYVIETENRVATAESVEKRLKEQFSSSIKDDTVRVYRINRLPEMEFTGYMLKATIYLVVKRNARDREILEEFITVNGLQDRVVRSPCEVKAMDKVKVILRLSCGTGMESAQKYVVSRDAWDEYNANSPSSSLEEFAYEEAVDFAASYGIYAPDEDEEDEDVDGNDEWEQVCGWFEEYHPKEHDGIIPHGEWNEI